MKRFAFRLESVLRVRRIQEDQARARLLAANREVQLAVAAVAERQRRYDTLDRPHGTLSRDVVERAWFSLDAAAGAVQFAFGAQIEAETRAAMAREAWTEARRRTQTIERLRERAHEEWLVEVRRDENRAVDDLVVARFMRDQAHRRRVEAHVARPALQRTTTA